MLLYQLIIHFSAEKELKNQMCTVSKKKHRKSLERKNLEAT